MLVRKTFKFEAAHRLLDSYTQRCRGIHGHSYVVELLLDGDVNLGDGMVLDFTLVKDAVGKFIDMFDHALIVSHDDKLAERGELLLFLNRRFIITPYPPTAELMAAHIFHAAHARLASNKIRVEAVRVHETSTGYAECREQLAGVEFEKTFFSDACRVS